MGKLLLILGGPNGCGKSSLFEAMRSRKGDLPFLNADVIAVATRGVQGMSGEMNAGRILLAQLRESLLAGKSVAFETTLSGQMWEHVIRQARTFDYRIVMLYVSLQSCELSLKRIAMRVALGGHHIPQSTVARRWGRSHSNFWNKYRLLVDSWYLFDNSEFGAALVAHGRKEQVHIKDKFKFEVIHKHVEKK